MSLLRQTLLFLSQRKDLEEFLRHHPMAAQARNRFVAGESRADALAATRRLNGEGFNVTLDYLGEEVVDVDQARAATVEYAEALEEAAAAGLDTGLSVKLSHLGVRIDEESAFENLMEVAKRAASVKRFVRVDMEGSDLTDVTLRLVRRAHAQAGNVGTVIQSYLRRSDADLDALNQAGVSVRLVKGAYLEPQEIAFQDPEETALYFMRMTERLIHSGNRPAFATHDETLIDFIVDLADIFEVPRSRFEFQMLYGIRSDLQTRLRDQGYRVRVYLPYGEDWYGYFMRRLAERPANLWFLLRHLKS